MNVRQGYRPAAGTRPSTHDDLLCPACGGLLIKGFYSLLRGGTLAVLRWAEQACPGCRSHH